MLEPPSSTVMMDHRKPVLLTVLALTAQPTVTKGESNEEEYTYGSLGAVSSDTGPLNTMLRSE